MERKKPRFALAFALPLLILFTALPAAAQESATITGRVASELGEPLVGASVFIEALDLGTLTNQSGRYRLVVPAARIEGEAMRVQVTAQLIGQRTLTKAAAISPGETVVLDFTLRATAIKLDEIVVTGQGTERERRKLTVTVNSISEQAIEDSEEANIISALAGKAPNVNVVTSSGSPGASAFIRIRGASSVFGSVQPLIVVDGTPITNASHNLGFNGAGTLVSNRGIDLNPADVESVEILKGAAATAIYGSRGANGVVLITTKSGTPGTTRVSYSSSVAINDVNETVPLQTVFGRGLVDVDNPSVNLAPSSVVSYGPLLPEGVPVYDHNSEVFETGYRFENNLSLSGGSEGTTYYLSIGHLYHNGFIVGDRQSYERTAVRLKGTHGFLDNMDVSGNFAFTQSDAGFTQRGSNLSGVLLGAFRTPPEFNNCLPASAYEDPGTPCYLDPVTLLHRSYRLPNPERLGVSRGYDNPFWIALAMTNSSEVGRAFGNINVNWRPLDWLTIDYTLGADYANDERLFVLPKSSSAAPDGLLSRYSLVDKQYTSLLLVTAERAFSDDLFGSLTLGQNLNQREYIQYAVDGSDLIFGTSELDFTVEQIPDEFKQRIRTAGYFAQANVDLYNQIYLAATGRFDGSSTFGSDDNFFFYPSLSAAWEFTRLGSVPGWLNFGKLRFSYGQVGRQPPAFSNVTAFETETYANGWGPFLRSVYLGQTGVVPSETRGAEEIDPEVKTSYEVGVDLAFLNQRVSTSIVYYQNETEDVILALDQPPATGFYAAFENAATFENEGLEVTLDLIPVRTQDFSWQISSNFGMNDNCVTELAGAEVIGLAGFAGMASSVVAPKRDPETGAIIECYPFGVLYGTDFIRFGRGTTVAYDADGDGEPEQVEIDQAFPDAAPGALFIAPDGFPRLDANERVAGDPYPDWSLGIRNTFTLFDDLRISALVDIVMGKDMWNGTRGALYFFGTHEGTIPFHGAGSEHVFGCADPSAGEVEVCENPGGVAGPGEGEAVVLNWRTWGLAGLGNGFVGPGSQFVEDASFVKLRDVTVSYTLNTEWLQDFGFESLGFGVTGRNLLTFTDYSGIDPESNLTGATSGQGLEYFNLPRTRGLIFRLTLNR